MFQTILMALSYIVFGVLLTGVFAYAGSEPWACIFLAGMAGGAYEVCRSHQGPAGVMDMDLEDRVVGAVLWKLLYKISKVSLLAILIYLCCRPFFGPLRSLHASLYALAPYPVVWLFSFKAMLRREQAPQ